MEMGYKSKRMRKEELKKLAVLVENMEYLHEGDFGYELVLGFQQMAYRDKWDVEVVLINPRIQAREKYDVYMHSG